MAWRVTWDRGELVVRFEGFLDDEGGSASAETVAQALAGTTEGVTIVLDVRAMSGYAPRARQAWQTTLAPHRHKLRAARTIGASPMVRMGATVLGLFLGLSVHHES